VAWSPTARIIRKTRELNGKTQSRSLLISRLLKNNTTTVLIGVYASTETRGLRLVYAAVVPHLSHDQRHHWSFVQIECETQATAHTSH